MKKEQVIKIFNELLIELGLNVNQLAECLEMKRAQGLYDILNPKVNVGISKNMAEKICRRFRYINISYLLTGFGVILNKDYIRKLYDDCINIRKEVMEIEPKPKSLNEITFHDAIGFNRNVFVENEDIFDKYVWICNELFLALKIEKMYKSNATADFMNIYRELENIPNDDKFGWIFTDDDNTKKSGVQFYDLESVPMDRKLIPLYDDIASVGGKLQKGYSANMESNSSPAEWIDPGDWFKSATAAIRNYGDSMVEYPSGCILALREVQDLRLIVPGKDYVIETSEYRVTKKAQLSSNPEYIRAYSTNEETYRDGTLIHQPFDIPRNLIVRIFEVLGYVVKKGGGTIVFSNQK
ncbi:MAG: hypothetical protein FWF53_09210 [Candidatus Azobacteroides sp.]|nr:hypothetical protein [Candidatus Azobacteroides sp.]